MRSNLGRFHRPMSRGLVNNMLTMNNLGDGSTLSLDFTTGVLDPRLTFTRASTVATYINSSGYVATATTNEPRFDYSPTNIGEPRGLLIEGQGINLLPYSNILQGGSWLLGGSTSGTVTITNPYTTTNPANGSTCTRLQFAVADGGGSPRLYYITSQTLPYTMSLWMKSNTAGNHTISIYQNDVWVDCTVTPTWQRFQTTRTSGSALLGFFMIANNSTSLTPDILVYGAQLEAGSGASSYIPTGASQVTRNADSCLMSGTNFSSWFNGTEGTCLFVGDNSFVPAASNFSTNWALISAANSMRINNYTRHTSGRLGSSARDPVGTALTFDSPSGSPTNITTTAVYKTAFALKTNDFAYCVNGNTVGLGDASNGVFETVTSIEFARDGIRNGHIKQFKFYPTRLINAQLQTITAP